jgi:hypothetical protein
LEKSAKGLLPHCGLHWGDFQRTKCLIDYQVFQDPRNMSSLVEGRRPENFNENTVLSSTVDSRFTPLETSLVKSYFPLRPGPRAEKRDFLFVDAQADVSQSDRVGR